LFPLSLVNDTENVSLGIFQTSFFNKKIIEKKRPALSCNESEIKKKARKKKDRRTTIKLFLFLNLLKKKIPNTKREKKNEI